MTSTNVISAIMAAEEEEPPGRTLASTCVKCVKFTSASKPTERLKSTSMAPASIVIFRSVSDDAMIECSEQWECGF